MGCCLSTITPKSSQTNPDLPKSNLNGGAPPLSSLPPPVEEETVKEVLSETPIPKPTIPTPNDTCKIQPNKLQNVAEEVNTQPPPAIKPSDEIVSELSDLSEMCSFSESLSTVTEKRDDDGEVTQRIHRSPSKKVIRKQLPTTGGVRSPSRRSEPSPVKRTQTAQGRTMTTMTRRNVGPPNAYRRDAGDSSARRSRSPATRETGPRPPVRSSVTPTGRCGGERSLSSRENMGAGEIRNNDVVVPETAGDSLENPNISLECFIFL